MHDELLLCIHSNNNISIIITLYIRINNTVYISGLFCVYLRFKIYDTFREVFKTFKILLLCRALKQKKVSSIRSAVGFFANHVCRFLVPNLLHYTRNKGKITFYILHIVLFTCLSMVLSCYFFL